MNGFDVRFSYISENIKPSNINTNEITNDAKEYFTFVDEFNGALEMKTLTYDGTGSGIRAIVSFKPPITESEHIMKTGESSGRVVNTQNGVLIGKMSFQMLVDEFDKNWFSLETSTTSAPKTGIMINIDGINSYYYDAQTTFNFTDNTASKNADLSNLIVSSGIEDENEENSTYKEYVLNPIFNKDIYNYELKLYDYIEQIDIKALLSDEKSNMKIKVPKKDTNNNLVYESDGTTIVYDEKDITNNIALPVFINKIGEPDTEITINVTAEDGKTEKEYKLVLKRPYGTIKGKIYTEPTTFTTEKHIAEVLAYSDKDLQGIVDWDSVISNTKASDDLNAVLRGNGTLTQTGIAERNKLITNDDGTFELYLLPGIYHLLIDKQGYLDQIYINVEIIEGKVIDLCENEPEKNIELIPGDINKDSSVGILDKTIMTKENGQNKTDHSDFNSSADLNDDGKINITDKTILTKNNNLKRKIINLKGGSK